MPIDATAAAAARSNAKAALHVDNWKQLLVVLAVLTSLGGFIFSATTVSMPKIFEERVVDFAGSLANASLYATFVYMIASLTQVVVGQAIDRYAIKPILLIVMAGQALTLFPCRQRRWGDDGDCRAANDGADFWANSNH